MTNGDRIRQMSNEELANILCEVRPCCFYCIEKYNLMNKVYYYYHMKQNEINKLQKAYDYSLEHREVSAKSCAIQFNIKQSQVENWRRRKTGVQLPKSFPTFNEYCPL